MIGSLVRWSGRSGWSARRFTPQVEALEGRETPGGVPGGVVTGSLRAALLGAKVGTMSGSALSGGTEVTPFGTRIGTIGTGDGNIALSGGSHLMLFGIGSMPGGAGDGILSRFAATISRSSGEEIPQQ